MKKPKKYSNARATTTEYSDPLDEYEDIESDESDSLNILDKFNDDSEESSAEEEVLPVFSGSGSSSQDEISEGAKDDIGNEISDSDIEGAEDDLPDSKAWGRQKRLYYNADRINDKSDFLNEEEEEAAKMEEEEARTIQKRLISEIDTADLSLDLLSDVINEKKEDHLREKDEIELDLSRMSATEKLKLLKKECPELLQYLDDYTRLMSCLKNNLLPLFEFINGNVFDEEIVEFVKTYRQLIMNYCTNIMFFVLLKARRTDTKSHPVVAWITRYRNMLHKMEPIYEKKIKSQFETVLSGDFKMGAMYQKKRKSKSKSENNKIIKLESEINSNNETEREGTTSTIYNPEEEDLPEKYDLEESDGKRPITREIAKNRGLTPRRKKEQRNPRVKHRMKYRKAKIRRKGQVREVRKELQKYGGEISGIKTTVVKSIKLKS